MLKLLSIGEIKAVHFDRIFCKYKLKSDQVRATFSTTPWSGRPCHSSIKSAIF